MSSSTNWNNNNFTSNHQPSSSSTGASPSSSSFATSTMPSFSSNWTSSFQQQPATSSSTTFGFTNATSPSSSSSVNWTSLNPSTFQRTAASTSSPLYHQRHAMPPPVSTLNTDGRYTIPLPTGIHCHQSTSSTSSFTTSGSDPAPPSSSSYKPYGMSDDGVTAEQVPNGMETQYTEDEAKSIADQKTKKPGQKRINLDRGGKTPFKPRVNELKPDPSAQYSLTKENKPYIVIGFNADVDLWVKVEKEWAALGAGEFDLVAITKALTDKYYIPNAKDRLEYIWKHSNLLTLAHAEATYATKEALGEIKAQVTDLQTKVSTEFDAVSTEFHAVKSRLDALESGFNQNQVQAMQQHFQPQLLPIQNQVNQFQSQLQPMQTQLNQFQSQLQPIRSQVNQFQSQLEPIQNQVNQFQSQLQPIQTQMNHFQTQVTQVQAQMHNIDLQSLWYHSKFYDLNSSLRCDVLDEGTRIWFDQINRVLMGMAPCPGTTYRGLSTSKIDWERHFMSRGSYDDKALICTSLSAEVAMTFALEEPLPHGRHPVLLEIQQFSGRYIADHVAEEYKSEREVLLLPNTQLMNQGCRYREDMFRGSLVRYLHVRMVEYRN